MKTGPAPESGRSSPGGPDGVFDAGGEMGALMRLTEWASTPLGRVDSWPQSLRSVISICLGSRFPIAIYWGPQLTLLYNDAWSPIPGGKHPWALGRPAHEVWPEIWETIGPMFLQVMSTGESTYSEDALLPMHRHGYTEECTFNFTFTPIRGEGGRVEGVFNAVIETTFRVISERRARVLRELGERIASARSEEDACTIAASTLERATHDVAFSGLYLLDDAQALAKLVSSSGVPVGDGMPAVVPLPLPLRATLGEAGAASLWPFGQVEASGEVAVVSELHARTGVRFPGGVWPEPCDTALVAPLLSVGRVSGFLVLGTSPRRAVDEEYRQFATRAASLVAISLANARAFNQERQRAEALAEIDRAKTAFFSNVSHEFRTPLTLMLGPQEDALRSAEGALRGEDLRAVHRNTLRLLKLVNSLLDFARLEAGRLEASYQPTDLAALTRDLVSTFRAAVERGGVRLEVDCPVLPQPVHVDRDMWEKIVLNLLSNAFKFTFAGSISVTLRAVGDGTAQLEVADTGIGIAETELPRLFERFHRIEGARARTHEGSGIGLALVNDLVRLQGGVISVASRPERGTTFTVVLPFGTAHLPADRLQVARSPGGVVPASAAFVAEAERWVPPASGMEPTRPPVDEVGSGAAPLDATAGARVLVVDDNADMQAYVTRLLSARWTVEAVGDGVQALEAARARPPDLIVSDVMMPNLDGFGLLRALRAEPRTAEIPVIMLSARAGDEARVEGLEAGADDYLAKPFSGRELVARAATHIQLARLRRAADDANRTKDEFLAMLGHELRNPLSPILTALQLMRMRGAESREQAIIARQVNHLIRLVDDLLDISRITRGKIELRRRPMELGDAVSRGLEVASPLLEQRQLRVDCVVPSHGVLVDGDPDRLSQVVSNLLNNAAKYSDAGQTVQVTVETAGGCARLRVRDQGAGIAADMLDQIFDMFVQQSQSIDRSKGGLGLGLAIVRSVVSLHGGTVTAASDGLGKGSEFLVELPLIQDRGGDRRPSPLVAPTDREADGHGHGHADRAADAHGEIPSPSPHGRPMPGKSRVLVVDDNLDAAETIGEALREVGFQVKVAHEGPKALALAMSFKPNVCLLDIGLPVMDGYELARRLRALADLPPDLRLVALTGYGQDADQRRSREAGFDAHLVKPVNLDRLEKTLFSLWPDS